MDLTLRFLGDAANAKGAFTDIGTMALAAGKILKDFTEESVKKFAEGERAMRQLRLAAGEYTEALSEQAEVTKKKFAVDDDQIRQMQTLLLRYGAAPGQIRATTEAILDYAAATGKDARGAIDQLIRGVESGSGSLGRMGVHFKATKDFAKDLTAATQALSDKFGGAGEEDAKSLDGRMRSVTLATDDFKKAMGGLFNELEQRTGLLDKIASTIDRMTTDLQTQGWRAFLDPRFGLTKETTQDSGVDPRARPDMFSPATFTRLGAGPDLLPPSVETKAGKSGDGGKQKDDWGWGPFGNPEASFDGWVQEYREQQQKKDDELLETALKEAAAATERNQKEIDADEKHEEEMLKSKRAIADLQVENEYKTQEDLKRIREKADADEMRRLKHVQQQWAEAGDRMGAALVNAIGKQLLRLTEGGDVDPAEMAGDVVSTILGIVGIAVGTYFGAPQVGGAIGGLAGGLAKTGIVSAFGRQAQSRHSGGAIERYHSGGWPGLGPDEVPIIGQIGENMWSRADVRRAGGPAAVEQLKRGGGGREVHLHVNTIDSRSFTDAFGREGGRGVYDALRVGRGELGILFS